MPTPQHNSDLIPVPRPWDINSRLSPLSNALMFDVFGKPGRLTRDCSPPTLPKLKRELVTESVGPFNVTGLRPLVASLKDLFAEVREKDRDLYEEVKTAGMLCCRAVRGSTTHFSNHSWGAAIDLYFGNKGVAPLGQPVTHRGVLKLYRAFHERGWWWGAAFSRVDSMHLEISKEKLLELYG